MSAVDKRTAGERSPAVFYPRDWVEWRDRADHPVYTVSLWPNRSMTPRQRKLMLSLAALGLSVPLIPAWGTHVFWGLLPFPLGALAMLWLGFRRSDRDGRLTEVLTLWRDEIRVERREPGGRLRRWSADPYKVRVMLHEDARPENYLTLIGGSREIELGAFLSPGERLDLKGEVDAALIRAFRA
ncbi:MAG: DUF2244 domain-containing protein [Pseudomonadota bacterium]